MFEALEGRMMMAGDVAPMTVGMNLNSVDYWSTAPMFVDAMKEASDGWFVVQKSSLEDPWSISGVAQPPMDANGYPIGLGSLGSSGYALTTAPFLHNGQNFPAGAYTLLFDGDGTVVVHQGGNNVTTVDQSGGAGQAHAVNVVPSDLGILVSITRSDPSDYVRNIRLIMPGFADTYQSQPFNPAYLNGLKSFNVLRFMDAMDTNGQAVQNWSERTTASYRTQTAAAGLSVEYMVQLANTLHEDMWVNMPALAQDDYVQGFAQYVKNNLDPGLRAYVEYGNEDWNYGPGFYTGFSHVDAYAKSHGLDDDQATADLAKHDWDIWRQVFGGQDNRVLRVVADQFAAPGRVNDMISRLVATSDPTDPDHGFEIISGAPYFAPDSSGYTAATTVRNIVADSLVAAQAVGPQLDQFLAVRTSWERALGRNIPVIMYEGGWGLTATPSNSWYQAYLQAQTDPGMYQVTQTYLNTLSSHGVDGLTYYSYVTPAGQYGEWGSMESLTQASSLAPKFDALQDYALAVPPTVSDVEVTNRTASGATVTWTTSEPSTSQVEYGGSASYGVTSPLNPTPESLHSVTLTGLSANALYHFRVDSSRANGVSASSSDVTLSTDVTPPTLFAVEPTHVEATSVTISWTTSKLSYGRIDYSAAGELSRFATDPVLSMAHSITLAGLAPGTVYHYNASSTDSAGNSSSSGFLSATTASAAALDPLAGAPLTLSGSGSTAGTPGVVATQGRYAYVAGSTSPFNLQVFDIGGGSPSLLSTVAMGVNYPTAIAVEGHYAYIISVYNGGLLVYDVSNPAAPKFVSATDVGYHPYDVAIQGRYAYITHYDSNASNSTLSVFDVGDPARPTRLGLTSISLLSKSVVVDGRYAYVTGDGTPNFQIFDVSNPANPSPVGAVATGYSQQGAVIEGHYAFVAYAYSGGGLQVVDVADPADPVVVSQLATASNPVSIRIDGHLVYLVGDATKVVDVTDPRHPALVASYATGGASASLDGRQLVTVNSANDSLGVSDVGGDALRSVIADPANARMFAIDSTGAHVLVFATNSDGTPQGAPAFVIGIDTPGATVSRTSISRAAGVAYDGATGRLYVSDAGNNRVLVFDAAHLASGMAASFVLGQAGYSASSAATSGAGMSGPAGVAYDGATGRLYVSDAGNNRVLVFDAAHLASGMAASFVLGQADFTHGAPGSATNRFNAPSSLVVDGAGGRLFVGDSGNDRVLTFGVAGLSNGMSASGALGASTAPGFAGLGLVGLTGLSYDSAHNRLLVVAGGTFHGVAAPLHVARVSVVTSQQGTATIRWATDIASNSQVEYGPTVAYGLTSPLLASSSRTHSVTLTGLRSGVTYHLRVLSQDANGDLDVGTDLTFTMP